MTQILYVAIVLAFLGSPIAWCNDIEDLQAAVVNEYNAWARRDCKAVVGMHTSDQRQRKIEHDDQRVARPRNGKPLPAGLSVHRHKVP